MDVPNRLIDLKNIFAKQLPNMPKEYIVRLIFDHRHKSLLALKARPPGPPAPHRRRNFISRHAA